MWRHFSLSLPVIQNNLPRKIGSPGCIATAKDVCNHKSIVILSSKSVLKRHVQFCLITSMIARVHGKVRPLSKGLWLVQPITEQFY